MGIISCGPKLRHILWRACKGSLLVNVVRYRRHMHDSDMCTLCDEASESICNALLDCREFRDMWLKSPFYFLIHEASRMSIDTLFLWLHSHSTTNELSLICSFLWACWMGRNKSFMKNTSCNLIQLSLSMKKMMVDYKAYAQKVFTNPIPRVPSSHSWQSPNSG